MHAEGLHIFQTVCLSITVLGLAVTCIYLAGAAKYQKSSAAFWDAVRLYQEGKDAEANAAFLEGKRLKAKAERFARWLPR